MSDDREEQEHDRKSNVPLVSDDEDARYFPFRANYTDADGEPRTKHFATNAAAHEFRATLVDGKLPFDHKETKQETPKAEPKAPADSVKSDAAKTSEQPQPPVLTGMIEKTEPAPKKDANPPVAAAGRP